MAKGQLLDGADVIPVLRELGREGTPERVWGARAWAGASVTWDVDTDVTQVSERGAAHDRFENGTVLSRLSTRPHARRIPEAPPTDHRGDPRDERA